MRYPLQLITMLQMCRCNRFRCAKPNATLCFCNRFRCAKLNVTLYESCSDAVMVFGDAVTVVEQFLFHSVSKQEQTSTLS